MSDLRITELDFDAIKQNLKDYLRARPEFTDFDFEGSGLSNLLDVLAYNTHYNAYMANMLAGEMFIDSAVKRESVVSLAKMLGYLPRSNKAATAIVDIVVNAPTGSPSSLTLDRYTQFNSRVDDISLSFVNTEPITIEPVDGIYLFEDVELKEGQVQRLQFVSASPGPAEKFPIYASNADLSTLRVRVQTSATDTTTRTYKLADGIDDIGDTSRVYFLEETPFGYYNLYFGDGVFGESLVAGNIILVEYLVTIGSAANVSEQLDQSFDLSGTIEGNQNVTITTVQNSVGGAEKETADEIRFSAPKFAQTQNRAVTENDYLALIKAARPDIESVAVWGGEKNDPPVYGKVFISLKPRNGFEVSFSTKNAIVRDVLSKKKIVSIVPEFVDPDYFFILINAIVRYDPSATDSSANDVKTAVRSAIETYFTDNLSKFDQDFYYSRLSRLIDAADDSIVGNQLVIRVQKRLEPVLNSTQNIRVQFNNKIKPETLASTRFIVAKGSIATPARIRDLPNEANVNNIGTYRRTASTIRVRFQEPHTLTVGETVAMEFTGGAISGNYVIEEVPNDLEFILISKETGTTSGSATVRSTNRGKLRLYDPTNNETIQDSVGFVNYSNGLVELQNLRVIGYSGDQQDLRITISVADDSKDIIAERNQILVLDESTANTAVDRESGLSISILGVES